MKTFKRIMIYLLGIVFIALGISLSRLANLGISPISSVPLVFEAIWGYSLGKMYVIAYSVIVLLQFVVLRKKFKPISLLSIPIALVFGTLIDMLSGLMTNVQITSYALQVLIVLASVVLIAIGVYIYQIPKLVPMPAEGLANALSVAFQKRFGDSKTIVDTGMVGVALVLQIVFLGGLNAFAGEHVIVREGTILSALMVGQLQIIIEKLVRKYKHR